MNQKEYYKEILENNGYINSANVIKFLRENCVADFEVVAEIYGKGLSRNDLADLQEAIDEIEEGGESQ